MPFSAPFRKGVLCFIKSMNSPWRIPETRVSGRLFLRVPLVLWGVNSSKGTPKRKPPALLPPRRTKRTHPHGSNGSAPWVHSLSSIPPKKPGMAIEDGRQKRLLMTSRHFSSPEPQNTKEDRGHWVSTAKVDQPQPLVRLHKEGFLQPLIKLTEPNKQKTAKAKCRQQ